MNATMCHSKGVSFLSSSWQSTKKLVVSADSSQLCEDSFGPARKRTRLCVPRQLKFDASLKELPSVTRPAMTDAVVPECQPADADT